MSDRRTAQMTLRTHEQISDFFDDLDLIEPGVAPVNRWRPDHPLDAEVADFRNFCGIGQKN